MKNVIESQEQRVRTMATAETSVVIADTDEVVEGGRMVNIVGVNVRPHVQLDGEFDQNIQLVSQGARVREPLQVDDQDVG